MSQYYTGIEAIAISLLLKPLVCNIWAGFQDLFIGSMIKSLIKSVFYRRAPLHFAGVGQNKIGQNKKGELPKGVLLFEGPAPKRTDIPIMGRVPLE
jgi:hypothetical protein